MPQHTFTRSVHRYNKGSPKKKKTKYLTHCKITKPRPLSSEVASDDGCDVGDPKRNVSLWLLERLCIHGA